MNIDKSQQNKTFYLHSEFGELLELAMQLKDEGHEVILSIGTHENKKKGDGIVTKDDNWWNYMRKGAVFVFDGCADGDLQDWLRSQGETVFGGSKGGDDLENDRQLGQKLFKAAGFKQPFSKNFKNIDDAKSFVEENKTQRWILKQNGDKPKSLSHMGKFDDSVDMLMHLEELKKKWSETAYGDVDFDLMEIVEGLELAASAFFNGNDWMRDKDGKIVGYINFEEKKEVVGSLGDTTGEMGTLFIGASEDNALFASIIARPKIAEALRAAKYRGVFDINCIKTKDGMVALEATSRFGVPATSYEFIEGLDMTTGELIEVVAKGENKPLKINKGVGIVAVVAAKPFPVEADLDDEATSIGEKLWILENGKPVEEMDEDQRKHIHLENFYKGDDGYRVATKNGYLYTVTARGSSISDARKNVLEYIKQNTYIAGMKYRTDLGERVEKAAGMSGDDKVKNEVDTIKKALKKALYE